MRLHGVGVGLVPNQLGFATTITYLAHLYTEEMKGPKTFENHPSGDACGMPWAMQEGLPVARVFDGSFPYNL